MRRRVHLLTAKSPSRRAAQVERCTTHCKHDWKKCPFSHPTENARRRDPRLHNYIPESCPNYKELGACSWGASARTLLGDCHAVLARRNVFNLQALVICFACIDSASAMHLP